MLHLRQARVFFVWIALAFATIASSAHAQSNAEVDKLKASADEAMDSLRYADALDGYQKAYGVSHDARFLYNMGRALGALGQYPEAVEKLERFRVEAPADLRARVPQLEQLIVDFKKHVSTLAVRCNVAGAHILVRQKAVGETPIMELRVNAGSAVVEVTAPDYVSQSRQVTLPEGDRLEVAFELVRATTTGILVVRSAPPATSVLVDGKGFGGTPLEASLKPGAHELVLAREGYRDLLTSAVVERGIRRELDLRLEKAPSIFSRWWFWTIVGAVVVAGATAAVTTAVCITTTACERSADIGTIPPTQVHGP